MTDAMRLSGTQAADAGALWLLGQAVRVMSKGPEADMLGHLARYRRERWFA